MSLAHASRRLWLKRNEYPDQLSDFWYWTAPGVNIALRMVRSMASGVPATIDIGRECGFIEVPRGSVLF